MQQRANGVSPAVYGTWSFETKVVNTSSNCESGATSGFTATVTEDTQDPPGGGPIDPPNPDLIAAWDLTSYFGNENQANATFGEIGIDLPGCQISRGAGLVGQNLGSLGDNAFVSRDWDSGDLASAQTNNEYFELSISADQLSAIKPTSLRIYLGRRNNSPDHFALFTDLGGDNFTTQLGATFVSSVQGHDPEDHEWATFDLTGPEFTNLIADCH